MGNFFREYMETPTASLEITSNNTYDVIEKAQVVVNVPNPSTGSITVTTNTTTDVTNYASVVTNIPPYVEQVSSVPSTKSSDIIYNTSDSSYYLWEN